MVKYQFNGVAIDDGITDNEFVPIYNHYGMNGALYNRTFSYDEVCSYINNNIPLGGLFNGTENGNQVGHSMVIMGYAHFTDGTIYYEFMDPNYDGYVSMSGNSDVYDAYGFDLNWNETVLP